MTKDEALKLALEALENSVDLVVEDAYNAEQLYGNMPTRQGKVNGLKVLADEHQKAITAIKKALAQPDPYKQGYADAMNWKVQNHLEHLPTAQPEQKPFCYHDGRNIVGKEFADHSDVFPLYTSPNPEQQKPVKFKCTAIKEALAQSVTMVLPPITEPTTKSKPVYIMGSYVGTGEVASVTTGSVSFTGNGTAGRETDVKPTGFFFQADKIATYTSDNPEHQKLDLSLCDAKRVQLPVGEVYGWHGHGVGQPLCRFNVTEAEMPVGTQLYTSPPQRTWVGLNKEEAFELQVKHKGNPFSLSAAVENLLREKNT